MARSVNKVILVGNVGNEPELYTTQGGEGKLAKLSLATNRTFKDRGGQQQERTEWHRLTVFGPLADVVDQYVHKGDRIYVEGRIEYSETEDQQGNKRYWTDIIVNEMVLLGGSPPQQREGPVEGAARSARSSGRAPRVDTSGARPQRGGSEPSPFSRGR